MDYPIIQRLAPPGVTLLVAFLAYSSQYLFHHIEPGPLRKGDAYIFNALVASLLICYWRTCFTDPGHIPRDWQDRWQDDAAAEKETHGHPPQRQRWCRKCEMYKPPRAHHCKTCKRCITKMDHHCVWTANCVSHITLPHFIRFLAYAVASMIYLETFLYTRCAVLWHNRNLPSYLGPSVPGLVHLFLLTTTNTLTLFALLLLLGRSLWSLALNQTTIESWELERHHALLRRARTLGGYLYGPDGVKIRLTHQEFPWDIGMARNIAQAMGGWNVLAWGWPLARSTRVEEGLSFEHNWIEDPSKAWPPPDPDRMFRAAPQPVPQEGFDAGVLDVQAFKARQEADLSRRYNDAEGEFVVRRKPFWQRLEEMQAKENGYDSNGRKVYEVEDEGNVAVGSDSEGGYGDDEDEDEDDVFRPRKEDDVGEEAWRNEEGERLADFGVDEVAEFYDEDDLPLGEILRRRKRLAKG